MFISCRKPMHHAAKSTFESILICRICQNAHEKKGITIIKSPPPAADKPDAPPTTIHSASCTLRTKFLNLFLIRKWFLFAQHYSSTAGCKDTIVSGIVHLCFHYQIFITVHFFILLSHNCNIFNHLT